MTIVFLLEYKEKYEIIIRYRLSWPLFNEWFLNQSLSMASNIARVECLHRFLLWGWVQVYIRLLHAYLFSLSTITFGFVLIIHIFAEMPRVFSRNFIRHGLLLCTSAIGTGFLGQYMLEVSLYISVEFIRKYSFVLFFSRRKINSKQPRLLYIGLKFG